MGKKRDKKRKHLLFYSACLLTILFSITGCAITSNLQKKPDGREYLVRSEALVAKGDYEGAIKENEEVLNLFPGVPPSDAALFQMGLIRINPGNPKRDYKGSLDYFQRLVNDFPQSTLINEANAWISTISQLILNDGRIKELEKTMNDLSQQVFSLNDKAAKNEDRNKDLEETIRGLRRQITVSKEADMNMEEKNRELEETIKVLKKQINDMKEIDIKIEEKKRKDLSGQINHN